LIKDGDIALYGKPISELWSVTCSMGQKAIFHQLRPIWLIDRPFSRQTIMTSVVFC